MSEIYLYTFVSVFIVSIISLVGVVALGLQDRLLRRILKYMVSFSAGALLGDVFLHVIPELSQVGFGIKEGWYFLTGIVIFFVLEKYILWHHSHGEHEESVHSSTYLTIFGDSLHNLIDGMIIAASFLVDIQLGIAATIAVVLHEIPQEMGQFAILIHGGWKTSKAIAYNFFSALTAVLGAAIVLFFAPQLEEAPGFLLVTAAASFLYIALSDLIPQMHSEKSPKKSILQLLALITGMATMALLLFLE